MMGVQSGSRNASVASRLKHFTPYMAFVAVYLSLAALNFGYDVATFGGVQAMPAFIRKFGELDTSTGKYSLPAQLTSLMNALPFLGKLVGALSCGPIAEKYGRKLAVLILALISLVGVTLQTAATSPWMFLAGRVINFAMTGFCVVVTPIYQAECAPPELRGMIASTLQFQIMFGSLIATLVNYGTQTMEGQASWMIPIGLQFVVPVMIIALLPLMPESPRWLLSKGLREKGKASLQKLRGHSISEEEIELEIVALESHAANTDKGQWRDLFNAENNKRTTIAIIVMFFQQATGQAFTSQYGIVFYRQQGIANPFLLGVIGGVVGLFCTSFTSLMVDGLGRRPILIVGAASMTLWLFVLGGVGTSATHGTASKNTMVASLILYSCSYGLSWAPLSYVILGEVAKVQVKEKTNNLAASISIITTFVISYTVPYLIQAKYAGLGAKVGFIYGSLALVSVVVAFFFVPEMKGKTLEEIDALFASGLSLREFDKSVVELEEEVGENDSVERRGSATNKQLYI